MGPSYNDSFGSLQSPGMGGTEPMITSGGGDVVLPTTYDGGGNKRRWPMMVAIALFVIAIIAGVGAVVVGNSGKSGTAKNAFSSYYKLMTSGKDGRNSANNSGEWYFYRLRDGGLAEADLLEYTKLLNAAHDSFNKLALETGGNEQLLNAYSARFDLWLKYVSLPVSRKNIIKMYVDQGEGSALDYIQELTAHGSGTDETVLATYEFLDTYLVSELELAKFYNRFGCIVDYSLDMFCMDGHMDGIATYERQVRAEQAAKATLDGAMVDFMWNDFVAETNKLKEIFGEKNE